MGAKSAVKVPVNEAPTVKKQPGPVTRRPATAAMILGAIANTFKPRVLTPEQQKEKDEHEQRQLNASKEAQRNMARRFGCLQVSDLNFASRRPTG